jgi:hypothetical protein
MLKEQTPAAPDARGTLTMTATPTPIPAELTAEIAATVRELAGSNPASVKQSFDRIRAAAGDDSSFQQLAAERLQAAYEQAARDDARLLEQAIDLYDTDPQEAVALRLRNFARRATLARMVAYANDPALFALVVAHANTLAA